MKKNEGSAKTKKGQSERKKVAIEENPSGIKGVLTLDEDVVSSIAGLAAREVEGIAEVGKAGLISFGDDPRRGIETEVGKIQAAFDVDVVIDYGSDISEVAKSLRSRIADEVKKMAGREVVEINIHVVDIRLPEHMETKKARVV
ncbi:MAG: Asp23/Gls24 family envelope stress response protein [Polyangia bacterium]